MNVCEADARLLELAVGEISSLNLKQYLLVHIQLRGLGLQQPGGQEPEEEHLSLVLVPHARVLEEGEDPGRLAGILLH